MLYFVDDWHGLRAQSGSGSPDSNFCYTNSKQSKHFEILILIVFWSFFNIFFPLQRNTTE